MASVLLIDDEEIVRRVVRVVLEAEGYQVFEAPNGDVGLTEVAAHDPDAVVLDVLMPGVSAGEVCKRIKKEARAKVVILTSLPDDEARAQAQEWGADDYMVKPFSSLELIERIEAMLGAS